MANDTRPDGPKPIPVRLLKFSGALDIPGKEATEGIKAGGPTNGTRFDIEFQPWIRHHKITCHRPGEKAVIVMVHESRITTWEPQL